MKKRDSLLIIYLLSLSNLIYSIILVDQLPSTFLDIYKSLKLNYFSNPFIIQSILKFFLSVINQENLFIYCMIAIPTISLFLFTKKYFCIKYDLILLIFIFNPFIYSRIMVGQFGIITALFFLPMYIGKIIILVKNKFNVTRVIYSSLLFTLVSSFAPHYFIFNLIIFFLTSYYFYDCSI